MVQPQLLVLETALRQLSISSQPTEQAHGILRTEKDGGIEQESHPARTRCEEVGDTAVSQSLYKTGKHADPQLLHETGNATTKRLHTAIDTHIHQASECRQTYIFKAVIDKHPIKAVIFHAITDKKHEHIFPAIKFRIVIQEFKSRLFTLFKSGLFRRKQEFRELQQRGVTQFNRWRIKPQFRWEKVDRGI
jgi:hypothetical protein